MIQLFSHQHWGEFNHVGFNAEAFQRTSGFQAQQATADHGTAFDIAWTGKAKSESMAVSIQLAMQISRE